MNELLISTGVVILIMTAACIYVFNKYITKAEHKTSNKTTVEWCEKIDLPEYRSAMKLGSLIIYNTKHFNFFYKKMWNIFFGVKIEDIWRKDK